MPDAYAQRWTELRAIRKRMWYAGLCLFVAAMGYKFVSDYGGDAKMFLVPIILALGIVSAVIFGKAYIESIRWKCPRCGEPYHSREKEMSAFAKRCLHCKLPLGADETADPSWPV